MEQPNYKISTVKDSIEQYPKITKMKKTLNLKCPNCNDSFTKDTCSCDKSDYYNELNEDKITSTGKIDALLCEKKDDTYLCELDTIITKNEYIQNCKSNKKKDIDSLSSLITRQLSQSDCIKLGNGLEKIFYDIILHYTKLKDVKQKNKKGKKEKDHLFCDEDNKIIYYAEFKSNINLDTEKSKSTYEKCLDIVIELKEKYPDYIIQWCLVGCRYIDKSSIPSKLRHKYKIIEDNLLGVNEYLQLLNINFRFTYNTYCIFLNKIADTMFE